MVFFHFALQGSVSRKEFQLVTFAILIAMSLGNQGYAKFSGPL